MTIDKLRYEGTTLGVEEIKYKVVSMTINSDIDPNGKSFITFCCNKTEIIPYIVSKNACPDSAAFMNISAIATVNEIGLDYFHNFYNNFYSLFTPEEIANGYPSKQTFEWASEKQMQNLLINLIPCYGDRIALFKKQLQYLDAYQVNALTPKQIQAISNANIKFPTDSKIYQKLNEVTSSKCCLLI